jgi:hypothetical protein
MARSGQVHIVSQGNMVLQDNCFEVQYLSPLSNPAVVADPKFPWKVDIDPWSNNETLPDFRSEGAEQETLQI